ncbi:hypothetical protein EDC01DRAFT_697321 [Geopyxis carbonaria]|nr:hypothetical protein EDC01DRAFT_697321 [Geopyxis carbonaria]
MSGRFSRGGARGGARGARGARGSFRGRGRGAPRGRGGAGQTRGRGRGRGGAKFSRTQEPEQESESESEPSEAGLDSEDDDDEDDDDEVEDEPEVKPFNALLESLAADRRQADTRQAKRRKFAHEEEVVTEEVKLDDEEVEEEEDAEEEADEVADDNDADEEDAKDHFETHFANPSPEFLKGISDVVKNQWQTRKLVLPKIGRCVQHVPAATEPVQPSSIGSSKDLKLKSRLVAPFEEVNGALSPLQKEVMPYVFSHQDMLFGGRTVHNADELRKTYCVHALNHVFKTRDRVVKNNARLSHGNEDLELRDQGFTRPKVLFILPTRNSCVQVVETLIALSGADQQENKKRFQDTYSLSADEERISKEKPEDFRELFGGNHDDLFRLGVKFTRKTMKFFAQFYNSDIILASPLGLRLAIGDEGDKKRDYDFLSSIELVIMDQADSLLQQNWDHVEHVFKHLNLIPKDHHGCDFGRVRNWYLDSNAKYLRQTIVLSQYLTPELNSIFTHHMHNIGGRLKSQPEYEGVMGDLGLQIQQIFTRFPSASPAADPDARFKHFTSAIMPSITRNASTGGSLVFIPSYFDFVRVRNHFDTLDISFGAISEETPVPDVARARSHFMSGRHSVLLYTGRAHHFRRYEIRGVRDVVLYALPDNPVFYKEVVGGFLVRSVGEGLVDTGKAKARVVFSKWDAMKLERVVGSKRVRVMCNDVGDTYEFV